MKYPDIISKSISKRKVPEFIIYFLEFGYFTLETKPEDAMASYPLGRGGGGKDPRRALGVRAQKDAILRPFAPFLCNFLPFSFPIYHFFLF